MTEKKALLIVDMLNDFVRQGAPLEVPSSRSIIPAIKRRIEEARTKGVPIIYVCDAHEANDKEFDVWPPHAVKGSEGAKVIDELSPLPGEIIVEKTRYSGFYRTQLEDILRKMGVEKVVIVGILTNICILFTAADAVMRGFEVEIPREGVTASSSQENDFALDQMAKVLGVKIV